MSVFECNNDSAVIIVPNDTRSCIMLSYATLKRLRSMLNIPLSETVASNMFAIYSYCAQSYCAYKNNAQGDNHTVRSNIAFTRMVDLDSYIYFGRGIVAFFNTLLLICI